MTDTSNDQVILVDKHDHEIGLANKLQAHEEGKLHRAISVFIAHEKEILLQQRADDKYHSAGLWSNTCCSHPRPGEKTKDAAARRLQEEMGVQCKLSYCDSFIYRAELDSGLIEHELDHVFIGHLSDKNKYCINPNEAKNAKWVQIETLKKELQDNPQLYTSWLKQALCVCLN